MSVHSTPMESDDLEDTAETELKLHDHDEANQATVSASQEATANESQEATVGKKARNVMLYMRLSDHVSFKVCVCLCVCVCLYPCVCVCVIL